MNYASYITALSTVFYGCSIAEADAWQHLQRGGGGLRATTTPPPPR